MHLRTRSLILVVIGGAVLATQLPASSISLLLRVILTLPLVFLLPGYAITETLSFGNQSALGYRLNLIVGLSMAVTALTGLLLGWMSISLNTLSWTIGLASVTLFISLVPHKPASDVPDIHLVLPGIVKDFRKTLMLTIAVGICIISLMIARNSAMRQAMSGFTQLWILPSQEMNQDIIRVGIYNMETPKSSFRLVVTADDRIIHEWPLIEVERDQPWEYFIVLSESYLSSSKVTATLYLMNNPEEPYRHVELFRDQ